jgi:ABC-type uncharacterized transport system permease subunit
MVSFEILQVAVIATYLVGSVLFLAGVGLAGERLKRLAGGFAMAGLALHGADLLVQVAEAPSFPGGGDFYLSLIAFCVLLAGLLVWRRMGSRFLALAVMPLTLFLFVASLAASTIRVVLPRELSLVFFGMHIASLVACLALLTLAVGAGLAFLHLNKKIKNKADLASMGSDLPSLDNFDRVNRWATLYGFPLYTLGLFSGFLWRLMDPERKFSWDPMNVTALAVWLLFAALFWQRVGLGWRGRKPALMAVAVFISIVVALLHHTITFRP